MQWSITHTHRAAQRRKKGNSGKVLCFFIMEFYDIAQQEQ